MVCLLCSLSRHFIFLFGDVLRDVVACLESQLTRELLSVEACDRTRREFILPISTELLPIHPVCISQYSRLGGRVGAIKPPSEENYGKFRCARAAKFFFEKNDLNPPCRLQPVVHTPDGVEKVVKREGLLCRTKRGENYEDSCAHLNLGYPGVPAGQQQDPRDPIQVNS